MGLKSKLKTENIGLLLASIFYAASGVACFTAIATMDYELVHVGLIGIISLITAYGLIRRRRWSLWSVFVLFFTNTTFAISMLYYTMGSDILIDTTMILYLILTWIATIYLAAKRKKLEL
ncbi:MAG: hypothetical protein QXK47_00800 [Candidatus Bathyarchaeia archaeon]